MSPAITSDDSLRRTSRLFQRIFIFSVAAILLFAASAKLISVGTGLKALNATDPVLPFSNQTMLILAALLELGVVVFLFINRGFVGRQLMGISWIGALFAAYKIAVAFSGKPAPCGCLGNLAAWMHMSPHAVQQLTVGLLVYIVAGALFFGWKHWHESSKALQGTGQIVASPVEST